MLAVVHANLLSSMPGILIVCPVKLIMFSHCRQWVLNLLSAAVSSLHSLVMQLPQQQQQRRSRHLYRSLQHCRLVCHLLRWRRGICRRLLQLLLVATSRHLACLPHHLGQWGRQVSCRLAFALFKQNLTCSRTSVKESTCI